VETDPWHESTGYEAYVGRWSRRVAERFLPWLDVGRGAAWIDIGCGTGVLTRAILDLEDPDSVVGIDPSKAFLSAARTSIHDRRVSFVEGTADAMPEASASADVIVGGLMLNFIPDLGRALSEMIRVGRPKSTIAGYVWDYAEGMQLIRLFWDAAAALDPTAAELDQGVRFPLCRPEALESAFVGAELEEVAVSAIDIPTVFPSFDDYWTPFLSGVRSAPAYVMSLDPAARERLRSRLDETLPREPDGSIELTARAWAVRGRTQGDEPS
jgi:SAM-dependent methyltransferase